MTTQIPSPLLKASVLVALSCASGVTLAQTWTGGTPYGGTVTVLLQSQDAHFLFAGTNGGLFRSDDNGLHWSRKLGGTIGSGPAEFAALARSNTHPGRLWIADARGTIHRSDDNGETIAATGTLPVAGAIITQLLVTSGTEERLFAATTNTGLWYSTDAGASFARADVGLDGGLGITKLIDSPDDSSLLMGFTAIPSSWSFYLSTNGGTGWVEQFGFDGPLTTGTFLSGGAMLVTSSGPFATLWRASFGGGLWQPQSGACWQTNSLLLDSTDWYVDWIGCDDGLFGTTPPVAPPMVLDGVNAPIRKLLRDRADPAQLLWAATDHVGIFSSSDAGLSWIARNDGLSATSFRSVAVHPHAHRLYAGYADEYTTTTNPALLFSDDDGVAWTASDLGHFIWLTRAITVDPTVADVDVTPVYAAGVDGVMGPGLFKSLDGGRTFSILGSGLSIQTRTVRDIALDPRSCASPPPAGPCTSGPLQTFYAIASGDAQSNWRVIRSDDAGTTLLDRSAGLPLRIIYPDNAGIEINYPISMALDPHDSQTILVGTYLQQTWNGNGAAPMPTLTNGVFRSRDGGSTWQAVNTGLPRRGNSADTAIDIYALASDPNLAGRIWAAGAFHDGNEGSTIFRSDDAGDHWVEQGTFADCDIRRLLADPQRAGTIRASGMSKAAHGTGCVLRSRDSGETWSRIDEGLPATRVLAMATMPGAPDALLVGTNSGVWHLRDAPDLLFRNGFD